MSSQGRWLASLEPASLRAGLALLSALTAALIVAQAWLLAGVAHGALIDGEGLAALSGPLLWLLATFVARVLVETARGYLAAGAAATVLQRLRSRVYRRIAAAGAGYTAGRGGGRLASAVIEQVDTLERWYQRYLPQAVLALVVTPVLLAAVIWQDWLAGLFLALAAPLIPFFMVLVGWGAERASRQQQSELARLGGVFLDRLRGLDTIRRFGSEAAELERLGTLIHSFRQRTMAVLRLAFLSTAVLEFFSAVAIAAVAIYVGLGLLGYIDFGPAGNLDLHAGLFVLLLAPEFFQPLRQLSQAWHDRADALAASAELRAVLETPPARPEPRQPVRIHPGTACRVDIESVTLGRPGRGPVLRSLDLSVAGGEHLLLRGPSGSGKSTLLDLIGGFLAPDSGSIRIDGVDLSRIATPRLASLRAWMGQHGGLFDGSLADNIRLSDPAAPPAAVRHAARLAGLGSLVEARADGLDQRVQASGEGLSGGQARRVLLARAWLRPRPLLLLDEPTASLDGDTAAGLWRTLADLSSGTGPTIICASHDPRAEAWAGRIVTLEHGRITEVTACD